MSGTGFILDFFRDSQGNNVPVLVCNKHVIKNSIHGEFVFNRADMQNVMYSSLLPS